MRYNEVLEVSKVLVHNHLVFVVLAKGKCFTTVYGSLEKIGAKKIDATEVAAVLLRILYTKFGDYNKGNTAFFLYCFFCLIDAIFNHCFHFCSYPCLFL